MEYPFDLSIIVPSFNEKESGASWNGKDAATK